MKKNRFEVWIIIILTILTILTFLFLFGSYFDLKIQSSYGYLTAGLVIIGACGLGFYDIVELVRKKEYLAMEMTTLAFSGVLIFINVIILGVYFLLVNYL